jgi:CRISPR-associated protein Cas2
MQCLLVYDIVDDGKRAKIAEVCLDYGLDRIQYSAFIGPLLPTHQDELMLKIKHVLGKRPGNIQLFPLCESDWDKRQVIAQKDGVSNDKMKDEG